VRKLRARLGAGDPAMLSRVLNTIEAEVVRAGLAQVAIPGLPDAIAEQMRALWQAAVAVQLDEVVALKNVAAQTRDAAETARHDADLQVELLRVELTALRDQISQRDTDLATARADWRSASEQLKSMEAAAAELRAALASANATIEVTRNEHAAAIAAVHTRYEGLSRQLLQETEHQRHALELERERLSGQITQAQERAAALEGLRDRLLSELASEREGRQRGAAEAAALTTLVAEQRALLQAVQTVQTVQTVQARPARTRRSPTAPAAGRQRRIPAASPPASPSPPPARSTVRRKAR